MNPQTLQKCVDELKKESPRLEYVIGILETLIELAPPMVNVPVRHETPTYVPVTHIRSDEEQSPGAAGFGPIGSLA